MTSQAVPKKPMMVSRPQLAPRHLGRDCEVGGHTPLFLRYRDPAHRPTEWNSRIRTRPSLTSIFSGQMVLNGCRGRKWVRGRFGGRTRGEAVRLISVGRTGSPISASSCAGRVQHQIHTVSLKTCLTWYITWYMKSGQCRTSGELRHPHTEVPLPSESTSHNMSEEFR